MKTERQWYHLGERHISQYLSVAQMLTELDYKILNCVTWAKTNPPPNLSCRYFTHSTEFIVWARKSKKVTHYYNYELMKAINGGHQMRDGGRCPPSRHGETQRKTSHAKPLCLLSRIILASTPRHAWVLDPFAGSSTTGIAANLLGRRYLGIDKEADFLEHQHRPQKRKSAIRKQQQRFSRK